MQTLPRCLRNGAIHSRRCPELIASPDIASFVSLSQHTPTRAARLSYMPTERMDRAAVLKKTALLSNLTPAEIHQLAARTVRKPFRAGELLFTEGELCHGLHIIARGKIRIFKTSLGGREQVLAMNNPGESVAELPVFDEIG